MCCAAKATSMDSEGHTKLLSHGTILVSLDFVSDFRRAKFQELEGVWYRVSQVEDLPRNMVRGLAFHSPFERSLALVLMPWRKAWGLTRETLPVMLCALAGLLLSGMELDHMTTWKTFSKVDKFLILVPIMLNLKGNLEMNLSLRTVSYTHLTLPTILRV